MTFNLQETPQGPIAHPVFESGETIESPQDFLDLIMSAPSSTTLIPQARLPEKFFDLKTGFAGELLQKTSTYQKRIIITGDFTQVPSKSLRDFIRESNSTGKVLFTETLEKALELLR